MGLEMHLILCAVLVLVITPSQVNGALEATPSDNLGKNEPCNCTYELKPVCGSDGVYYPNTCVAKCYGVKVDCDCPNCVSGKTCSCPLAV